MKNLFIKFQFIICFLIMSIFAHAQVAIAPIEFIENQGQWDAPFLYKGTTPRGDFFLSNHSISYLLGHKDNSEKVHNKHHGNIVGPVTLDYHAYRMNFLQSSPDCKVTSAKKQSHYYNYFLGNDANRWKNNIHPALNVDYHNVYNNIDLHCYSENGNLKYDVLVHAGANIKDIQFEYDGLTEISIQKKCLHLQTSVGDNMEMAPYAYQYINGEKVEVPCEYVLNKNVVSYKVGKNYNPTVDLVIDPIVIFCTFTGSTADNWGYTATYDSLGNFYAGGIVGYPANATFTGAYPTTTGAFQATFGGGGAGGMGNQFRYDASISKFNSTGTTLLYGTYLGGSDNDQPQSLIVDYAGNLVIAGRTYSTNFPTSTNAYDATQNGNGDLFVTKLNWTGTALIGSTFVGGSGDDAVNLYADENTLGDLKHNYSDDARSEVIVDSSNNVYVAFATSSSNFPMVSANQSTIGGLQDGVLIKLNNNLSSLLWSTFIGGSGNDAAYAISLNNKNHSEIFVGGGTMSTNFPTTAGTIHTTNQGGIDGWLRKYNVNTFAMLASTYIGTSGTDQVYGVKTDDSNFVYIMGQAQGAYPVTAGVYSNPNSSQFASKINNTLTTYIASTVYGKGSTSSTDIAPNAFLVDKCGNIYISGWGGPIISNHPGNTTGMPVSGNAQQSTTDGSDFYFIVFDANFTGLLYASFFGQNGGVGEHVDGGTSRFDPQGVIYQAICARCGNNSTPASVVFPTTPGVYSPNNQADNCNLASVKIDFQIIGANAVADASPNDTGCLPFTVVFGNNSTNAITYWWDFGDGSPTTTAVAPTHIYTTAGIFTVTLAAINTTGCITSDTAKLIIVVRNDSIKNLFNIVKIDSCDPFIIQATNLSTMTPSGFSSGATFLWNWGDATTSTQQNPGPHTYASSGSYVVTLTITDPVACVSPVSSTKNVSFVNNVISTDFVMPDTVCPPYTHNFTNNSVGATTFLWNFGDNTTSASSNPSHTYTVPGTYTVTLIIGNPTSCNKFDTATQVLHVRPSITSSFTSIKTDTCGPYRISITNNSIINTLYPGAAAWTKYLWDFGDNTTFAGANPASHNFPGPGTYTVTLTISDSTACNSPQVFTQVVTFVDNIIKGVFELPDTGCVPFTWVFNNTSKNVGTYFWNFGTAGAGSTSTLGTPSFTFTNVGTYTVTLIVGNPLTCNKLDSFKQIITVYPAPVADFYYLPNPPLPNKPVSFNNQSVGAVRYLWDFGDGTYSTLENPTHLYNKSAILDVCLTAYNQYGCPDTVCKPIRPEVVNIIDVPTGFSPNGDGENDFIQVRGYGVKEMMFKIYNRFGELVFSSTTLDGKWDGTYKGKQQEMDAFAYVLVVTFTDNSNITKKGNITLIR
jgi:gliding motility-associated-like protein